MNQVQKRFFVSTIFLLVIVMAFSKPLFTKSRYLIATYSDNATGTVSPGNSTYQLVYNADRDEVTALETDYWIIKNVNGNLYSFQNASTGKYIQYNSTAAERSALQLVDALQSDNSTYFTLELKQNNGLNYYIVRSASNTTKIWNRRTSASSGLFPVGVYAGTGSNNEQFIFYDSSGNSVIDDGLTAISLPTANRTLGVFTNYLSGFTFDGQTPIADTSKKEFYLTVPEENINSTLSKVIAFVTKNTSYTLYVNNKAVSSNSVVNFGTVNSATKISLEIKNGSTSLATASLYFTCLPIVQLYTDATVGSVYSLGRIVVTEPQKADSAEVLLTKIKTRGGISTGYAKKSMALNLRDSSGINSDDRSFFSLRNDNNWILDAMYIDPARMRNRVNTDIWNNFATKPYWVINEPKMRNGTRGHFVEVFQNDAYLGLYCMTERMDRKQLNLKKLKVVTDSVTKITTYTQRGTTIKGVAWSNAVLMGYPYGGSSVYSAFSNTNLNWSQYECKYPEYDEGEPIKWDNLYAALQIPNSYYTTDANFTQKVADNFDLPVYLDYYLFIELLLATDNHGKNTFTSIYDQTISNIVSITPWDLDGTMGIRWDGSKNLTTPNQDLDNFLITNEHGQVNLFLRLKSLDVNNWRTIQLKNRYKELRGGAFNKDSIMSRFLHYADIFAKSGADSREIAKWSSYGLVTNISSEMTYISNWLTQRLNYLDNQYLGAPYTHLNNMNTNILCGPNPVTNWLMISGLNGAETISIYSIQGNLLLKSISEGQTMNVDMSKYQPGVYIVKIGDYTAKIIKN